MRNKLPCRLSALLLAVIALTFPNVSSASFGTEQSQTAPTNGVTVNAVVFNKNGEVVTDLKKQNFAVFLDGVQKEVIDFTTPTAPLEAAVIVEYRYWGFAMDNRAPLDLDVTPVELFRTADVLLSRLLQTPQDAISVVAADMRPQVMTNLTSNSKQLSEAVDLFRKNRPALFDIALFDTLKLVVSGGTDTPPVLPTSKERTFTYRGMTNSSGKRRGIVAIISGMDSLSKTSYKDARRILQDAGIPIYVICVAGTFEAKAAKWRQDKREVNRIPRKKDLDDAEERMNAITAETGGAHYHYIDEADAATLIKKIQTSVASQYNLSFRADDIRDGKPHQIEVRIDADGDGVYDGERFVVQARQIYNAPKK